MIRPARVDMITKNGPSGKDGESQQTVKVVEGTQSTTTNDMNASSDKNDV